MSEPAVIEQAELLPAETETPPPAQSAAIIQVIERAALNPEIDVEKMERLLAMQERILDRDAKEAFNAAMAGAQAEMPAVVKDADNDQTKSKYARLEAINEAITPIVTKHGFATSFGEDTCPKEGHRRIICDVSHIRGHSRQYYGDVPVDDTGMKGTRNKTDTHAYGSTMTYGRRYVKLMVFDITLKDEDDDGNRAADNREVITEEQVMELRDLLESVDGDEPKFLKSVKMERLEDMWADKYEAAVAIIKRKARANVKGEAGQG